MSEAVVLYGRISSYHAKRGTANFFFSQLDQRALGMAAIGAAMMGAGGTAMGTVISSSDVEEEADQVEFMIDDKFISGWLWRSPFTEGDEVQVVAEKEGDLYSLAAIARPKDKIISMYPHLSRGRWAHIINSLKWWLLGTSALLIFSNFFLGIILQASGVNVFSLRVTKYLLAVDFIAFSVMLLPTIHMIFKYMHFVRAAETVFNELGWKNIGFIDLKKSSKIGKIGDEPFEYGTYYFRY